MPTIVLRRHSRVAAEPATPLYRRSAGFRRVLFLELIAEAISELERIETDAEAEQVFARLVQHRARVWGQRPWSGANRHPDFLAHVTEIAAAFTTTGVYRNRLVPPARSH